ncbi:MAG: AMP nucleosidase [Parvibaculum sp.]|nr:AMP nucleosidase [Parvibaculum sp.]
MNELERPMADETKTDDQPERITVLARDFTPAAMEFHRRNMSEKGYRMEGQIVRRKFQMIEGMGAPSDLFDGELFYAVTFIRKNIEK